MPLRRLMTQPRVDLVMFYSVDQLLSLVRYFEHTSIRTLLDQNSQRIHILAELDADEPIPLASLRSVRGPWLDQALAVQIRTVTLPTQRGRQHSTPSPCLVTSSESPCWARANMALGL